MSLQPFDRRTIRDVTYSGDDDAAPEIRKLLLDAAANEDDIDPWEKLITATESLEGGLTRNSSPSAIEVMRNVYDCLLAKFPYLFGFWKKYAELEFAIGGTETAELVFERGVSAIPNSVDLWGSYCTFKLDTCHDVEVIRELFQRGASCVGLDFLSHPFWDKYLEFEERFENKPNCTKILERVIHIPTYQYSRYFNRFRDWASLRPVEEFVDADTLKTLRDAVEEDNMGQPKSEPELDRALRLKIDHFHHEIYHRTQVEVQRRWTFEEKIKRPYFHVTELSDEELVNWRKYLDFEEIEGDYVRTTTLYERCLVTCALYDEFWFRYARWMFAQGKEEDTRNIYMRASCLFVPTGRPSIRLHWARFEEKLGRIDVARAIHEAILLDIPSHQETIISLAGIERRHAGVDAAVQLLEQYANHKQVEVYVAGALAAEQARILWRCKGSVEEARQLFQDKMKKYLDVRAFWINYLKFEIEQQPHKETEDQAHARIKAVHEQMRAEAHVSPATLKDLSHFYMEYLLDRGGEETATEYIDLDKEVNGPFSVQSQLKAKVAPDGQESTTQRRLVAENGHPGVEVNEAAVRRGENIYDKYYQEQGETPSGNQPLRFS